MRSSTKSACCVAGHVVVMWWSAVCMHAVSASMLQLSPCGIDVLTCIGRWLKWWS